MVQCTSLKSNMGHLEACAAAAGLASLLLAPLGVTVAAANAQLRRYFCMHRLIFWILFVVTLFQAERTFVIDRIVEIVVLLGARRGGGALGMPCRFGDRSRGVSSGSPELVWIQWDYRSRGILVASVDAATTHRRASQGEFSISSQDSRAARERPVSVHDVDVRIAEGFGRGK